MNTKQMPLILIADPEPRTVDMIFESVAMVSLRDLGEVAVHSAGQRLYRDELGQKLAQAHIVIGKIDLPQERLARMPHLKAIFNVEGNFLPNIDYSYCLDHGIHVLNISPVFAT